MTDKLTMTNTPCGLNATVVNQDTLMVELYGSWRISDDRQPAGDVLQTLRQKAGLRKIEFDTRKMEAWNSGLLTFLLNKIGRAHV